MIAAGILALLLYAAMVLLVYQALRPRSPGDWAGFIFVWALLTGWLATVFVVLAALQGDYTLAEQVRALEHALGGAR